MNVRFSMLAAVVSCVICSPLFAQLKLEVNRQSGDLTFTGVDSTAVDFSAYVIQSASDTLTRANWNGLRDTEADWVESGLPVDDVLSELNENDNPAVGSIVNDTITFDLGSGVYDSSALLATLDLGEDVEDNDITLGYFDQIQEASFAGVVEFTGEKIFNNIGITVDLADGKAYIENESPQASLTITGYIIESISGGTLNAGAGFTGLGGGFDSPTTPNGDDLGEIDSTGTGQALASSTAIDTLGIDLGVVVDPSSLADAFEDLTVSFILDGIGEVSQDGFVKYINVPDLGLTGDYNGDGTVNIADYTVWRDNLGADESVLQGPGDGSGTVDAGDYTEWKNNFGAVAPAAGALVGTARVPEPTAVGIIALALLGGVALRVNNKR